MHARILWMALLGSLAAGCITENMMKAGSVGHTGCLENEMTVTEARVESFGSIQQWWVDCRGKTFICDRYGYDIGCSERQRPSEPPRQ